MAKLAVEYEFRKIGLITTPYQVGSDDDLSGIYGEWKTSGYKELITSGFGKIRVPFSFIEDAQNYNALELVNKVGCPKLFIAGEQDDKVPLSVARKLYDEAQEPKEWHQIPGMVHKYKLQPEILKEVNRIIIDFIESDN